MSETFVKCSQRTARIGCSSCGSKNYYWGHDTAIYAPACTKNPDCDATGKRLMLDADTLMPHNLTCPGRNAPTPPVTDREGEETTPMQPTPVPAVVEGTVTDSPPAATAPPSDAFTAFQTLMESLAPKVDRAEVELIVKRALADVVFPTTVVTERATGERHEITGAHHQLDTVLRIVMRGRDVMMVGGAGTGKTTIARDVATSLGIPFYTKSCHATMTEPALFGFINIATGEYVRTLFREAYERGGVFLLDEADKSNPAVLAALNQAIANGEAAFPDGMVKRHPDFRAMVAANTYGRGADRKSVGSQAMDIATLDRFAVLTVTVDEDLERRMCLSTGLAAERVDEVLSYARRMRATADEKGMAVVVSPRGSSGMCDMIDAGFSWDEAADMMILKGMSAQDRSKIGA